MLSNRETKVVQVPTDVFSEKFGMASKKVGP